MSALGRTIKITGTPPNCAIEIDGTLTEVMSLDLHLDGGSLPQVVITPPVFEVDVYLEGKVELDENTKRTLLALGWTPPSPQEKMRQGIAKLSQTLTEDEVQALRERGVIDDEGKSTGDRIAEYFERNAGTEQPRSSRRSSSACWLSRSAATHSP